MQPNFRAVAVPIGRPEVARSPVNGPSDRPGAPVVHTPPIDIHEGPEGLVLEADLPGVSEKQLSIQVEDNVLSLRAQVDARPQDGARVLHEEYRPGDYYRSFILSDEVERSRITAELKNGVLRLVLPKAERARTRKIEIQTP